MTYHKDLATAEEDSPFATHGVCMCCGEASDGPLIGYDLVLPQTQIYTRALFHRDCAFAMAQRIICDSWPNRRTHNPMQNNR